MGFLSKLSGRSPANTLVRELLLRRVQYDDRSSAVGFTPEVVSRLSGTQLQASTEAAICSIVESHTMLVRRGATPAAALLQIESHRKFLGGRTLPDPLDLRSYTEYRVAIEHAGPSLPSDHLEHCLRAAAAFYGCQLPPAPPPSVQADSALVGPDAEVEIAPAPVQPSKALAARQRRLVEHDYSVVFQRRQGRLFFMYTEEQLAPEIQEQVTTETDIEEAVAMMRDMYESATVATQTACVNEVIEVNDVNEGWSETQPPWGEGYLVQRELIRSLNELTMPGEREIPDQK